MHDNDLDPRNPVRKPKLLDSYSLDELAEYINILKAEIVRVEREMIKKKQHRDAISGLFKIKDE